MKKFILLFIISVTGFSQNLLKDIDFLEIQDIDFDILDSPRYKKSNTTLFNKQKFLSKYFEVWNKQQTMSSYETSLFFNYESVSKKLPCIGENYNELHSKIVDEIKNNININIGKTPTVKYGLTLKSVNIRLFPTDEFCFKNLRNAGESYPFDYFQNSSLWIASPIAILGRSKDKLWYYINSQHCKGWVKVDDVVVLTNAQKQKFQNMTFVCPTKDKTILNSKTKAYKIYIGTLLPIVNSKILIPTKGLDNKLVYDKTTRKKNFLKFPLSFSKKNVKQLLSELHNFKYTWGGLNNGRDCSSTLKDLYTPFGLWLPRNSSQQIKVGKQVALKGSKAEKLATIREKAIPFLSFLFKKGHIVLYIGKTANKTITFQNVWGIKAYYKNKTLANLHDKRKQYGLFGFHKKNATKIETRFNIGRCIFTDVELGKKIKGTYPGLTTHSYLENLNKMSLLVK